jgi:hypothetical protein
MFTIKRLKEYIANLSEIKKEMLELEAKVNTTQEQLSKEQDESKGNFLQPKTQRS